MPRLRPIVIIGPTAGGKSELAVDLATGLSGPGQVLNADSMQVYRGMEAGTAKPSAELRRRAPHHLIDIVEPTERFTVADWMARADRLIVELLAQGVRPIIVGGTNLYIKALLEGMFAGPAIDTEFRGRAAGQTGAALHAQLERIDPEAAQRIHPNDHKKLVRALEVFHSTGQPISALQKQWNQTGAATPGSPGSPGTPGTSDATDPAAPPRYRHDPILIGLHWPTDALNRRINARVKEMFSPPAGTESLPEEVRRLESAGLLGPQAREALGYKQVLEHLRAKCSLDEAFEKTKVLTRRFAKTQRTWLRRYVGVHWLEAADTPAAVLAERAGGFVAQRERDAGGLA